MKIIIEELDIFILAGELVRGLRKVHVDMIDVSKGKMVRALEGLRIDVTVDDK